MDAGVDVPFVKVFVNWALFDHFARISQLYVTLHTHSDAPCMACI